MTSFQISISPSRRAAVRFVTAVRRALQKVFVAENQENGLKQSDIARSIGVHRSVIHRQLQGHEDITLGRVAELAHAMGRKAVIQFEDLTVRGGSNVALAETKLNNASETAGEATISVAPGGPIVAPAVLKKSEMASRHSRKVT